MNSATLSVADQNILFLTDMNNDSVLEHFKEGTNPNLILRYIQTSVRAIEALGRANFETYDKFTTHQSLVFRDSIGGINTHGVTMALAYLTDENSERYSAIHGCGMIINYGNKERGILLIGRHGSGKTTLRNTFRKNQTLDDDILMIDDESMQTVGKYGAITYTQLFRKQKLRKHLIGGISEANIDAIFILDKKYTGGYIAEEGLQIPREDSAIDSLSYRLYQISSEKPPIRVNVPVYRIGTDQNIGSTKSKILSVL